MEAWTAQYRYPGPHRLDITVKGQDPVGRLFAPRWDMVTTYKDSKRTDADKLVYIQQYHVLILDVIKKHPKEWEALLARKYLVLVCFCKAGEFCHRHLLLHYLREYGATCHGEITDFSRWNKQNIIPEFKGQYDWLSNFAPCEFEYQFIVYPTNEHFYQAWKFNVEKRAEIAALPHPRDAKKAGRKAKLCWNWNTVRVDVMRVAVDIKFSMIPFKEDLLRTGDAILVEGNYWHDNFWGNCSCPKCEHIVGEDMLGKLIMAKRDTLRLT